ncbi:unnamed protein product [Prorocentrum cordatum]|uniref:Uncharacterized protein n=1 Tax=Prorocentrum cordatum TaxID=2364126 RepID=A0ABN9TSB6_9DINO|nr:unnamed protein product [Polarella glacialis]
MPHRLQLDHSHDVLQKRQCLADRPLHVAAARMDAQRTLCDLALVPKESLVTWLNLLRPLAVMSVLPKMVGGAILESTKDKIHDSAPWQFAYREGHSVMDMVFIIMMMAQKCMQRGTWFCCWFC